MAAVFGQEPSRHSSLDLTCIEDHDNSCNQAKVAHQLTSLWLVRREGTEAFWRGWTGLNRRLHSLTTVARADGSILLSLGERRTVHVRTAY